MTTDELRGELAAMFEDYLPDDIFLASLADHLADCVLEFEPIKQALAQKAYAERMMSHSTGGKS